MHSHLLPTTFYLLYLLCVFAKMVLLAFAPSVTSHIWLADSLNSKRETKYLTKLKQSVCPQPAEAFCVVSVLNTLVQTTSSQESFNGDITGDRKHAFHRIDHSLLE